MIRFSKILLFMVIIPGTLGVLIDVLFHVKAYELEYYAIIIPWLILNQLLINKFNVLK